MPVNAPLLVRNTEPGPVVLSSDPKSTSFVEWAGAGDPSGNDVQPVPDEFRSLVQFNRCVQRGILVIENADDANALDAIQRQNEAWDQRRRTADDSAKETLDPEANQDIVALDCQMKGCNNVVQVRDLAKNDRAPLCSLHEKHAPEFVPTDDIVDNKTVRRWVHSTLGPREKQEQ